MLNGIILFVISYLFGSFPTAILAGKIMRKIDIREHGSGNAGATNVFRVLGWKAGIIVLLIDMLKGFIPVFWLAALLQPDMDVQIYYQIIAALAAIAGHIWTVFAGFKGGKGVGTSAGAFLGLAPLALGIGLIVFVLVVAVTRYVSLGSLTAALVFLIMMSVQKFVLSQPVPDILYYLSIIVVALIWFAHRSNIKRLLAGNENKLSFGGSNKSAE